MSAAAGLTSTSARPSSSSIPPTPTSLASPDLAGNRASPVLARQLRPWDSQGVPMSAAKADSAQPQNTSYWAMIKQTFSEYGEDKVPRLSAALAYYTMLSLAPLLIICIKIVGAMFGQEAANG